MRTRAQRRQEMPELTQKLQRRLRELETATSSSPLSPPAPKKCKTNGGPAPPLLLTPHYPKPRTPMLQTPEKTTETKIVPLRRTLQYTSPAAPEPAEDPHSVLQRLCSGQMLRSQPPIVGRVEEHQAVREVLTQGVQGGSLFIIGPPGTGKSSSVNALLLEQEYQVVEAATLKRKRVQKSAKAAVKLNCSTFTDPAVLYAAVAQQVRQSTSWQVPDRLDPFAMDQFVASQRGASTAKRPPLVVVLDEVDQLLRLPARMQPTVKEVLHFFVRWAAVAPRDVKFLGIMNGVDMYEQVSRVHMTGESADDSLVPRVLFGSYSHQDLLLIMQSYVQSALSALPAASQVDTFIEPRAMELIARKVAARDGDARLAISLLQQSARHALQRSSGSSPRTTTVNVTMRDVFQCATSMLTSPVVQQIKQLPRQAKLLLYVITALAPGSNESNGSGSPRRLLQCDMNQVSDELARLRGLPLTAWVPRLSREELQTHLMSLDCYALVTRGAGKRGDKTSAAASVRAFWTSKLSSCVTAAEVSRAVQDDSSLGQLVNLEN